MAKFSSKRSVVYENVEPIKPADPSGSTFIGSTLKIKGNITSKEAIILEGKIDGNITIKEKITIGKNGNFKGKIEADIVKILGKAKGEINATNRVEICNNGDFDGNVKTKKLIIEDGAIFNGNASMGEDENIKNPPQKINEQKKSPEEQNQNTM